MQLLFIGTTEIIVIALVIVLLFGGAKLPELMRGLGKGVKEFKDATKGVVNNENENKNENENENENRRP